jgi:hypothetical protein
MSPPATKAAILKRARSRGVGGGPAAAEAPFAGKSVLATGGSRGLGLLIACEMGGPGQSVAAVCP